MKLASLKNGDREGRLVVVSRDLRQAVAADAVAPTMRHAIDHWAACESGLRALDGRLRAGTAAGAFAFDPSQAMAPLPRSHQFVDASAFLNHGDIMKEAYKLSIASEPGVPILVPRQGDDFRGPSADYELPTEADQTDFEGEFAVITDDVPMGASAAEALSRVRLVTLLNDVSMRAYVFKEVSLGFGMMRAKPATVFAPVAVTPDELGPAWRGGRVHLDLRVSRNGEWFGHPNGGEMDFGFGELLAYMAYNRRLGAGLVLGSGTVSNKAHRQVGSACLAERRALETIEWGQARTGWMAFGERLRMEATDANGQSVFGAIDFRLVRAS
ncbi:fumarylacetoacetate hydrolase family protein [Ramlibacter sp. AW1]|uniref:Fumarylacetoacetate hydrolase family protein n=1 Tax=Ramlibacter aurantiacus TaxID=2801330 RepID=A0A937D6V5_9BURK|nr:fumarylacetoacetate hydrolase family protein [Ramlibacter aurantiacus]MBL0422692.1 fumarylacetoacetate hydrolase family protein [Ramlibacter aurantiacus]